MTGYELTEKLRKTRRRHRLSAATQALYYELVAICNEEGWPDEFKCSNDELYSVLQISEKSLGVYRLELIQAGLIYYLSGKSKKKVGAYSFKKEFLNGGKFYNQSDYLKGDQSGGQSDHLKGEKPSDLIKTKTQTEIFIVIKKEQKIFSQLNELFEADPGLKMKWTSSGMPAGKFSDAVKEWLLQNHTKEYHDFQKARTHFFFWMPNYLSIIEKKQNGTKKTTSATSGSGNSAYAEGF